MEVRMSRLGTQQVSGASFPDRQSRNPFFIRNNPHPHKVRHIKGLLDFPVCTVLDAGYNENHIIRQKSRQHRTKLGIGLKHEKFVPGIGIVSTQPHWMNELQSFTQKVRLKRNQPTLMLYPRQMLTCDVTINKKNESKPPPSRCVSSRQSDRSVVSRGQSKQSSRMRKVEDEFIRRSVSNNNHANKNITQDLNKCVIRFEDDVNDGTYVFQLLSQILQTDSLDDIKNWLIQAPYKEKEVVLEMVRAISDTNLQFREKMDELRRVKEPEPKYDRNILYHESSLDPSLLYKNKYDKIESAVVTRPGQQPDVKGSAKFLLDQLNQTVDIERNVVSRHSLLPLHSCEHLLLPAITEDEVEQIRSRLEKS